MEEELKILRIYSIPMLLKKKKIMRMYVLKRTSGRS